MNVSLTPELEKLVNEEVQSGRYKSASEVVREGLRLLEERRAKIVALRRKLARGLEQLDRDEGIEFASVKDLFDHVKAQAHKPHKKKMATRK
jgi:antitoxin ParD1/3/4